MRISIEVGHVQLLPGSLNHISVQRSLSLGVLLSAQLEAHGHETHFGVLADDKALTARTRERHTSQFIGVLAEQLPVAYFCPEHCLVVYLDNLIALIPKDGVRRRVSRELTGYLAQHSALPCSADIAIWHALRLGLIADTESITVGVDGALTPSDHVISIIPEPDHEPEAVARDRYLKHMPHDAAARVHRLYYPVAADQPTNDEPLQRLVSTLTTEAPVS